MSLDYFKGPLPETFKDVESKLMEVERCSREMKNDQILSDPKAMSRTKLKRIAIKILNALPVEDWAEAAAKAGGMAQEVEKGEVAVARVADAIKKDKPNVGVINKNVRFRAKRG